MLSAVSSTAAKKKIASAKMEVSMNLAARHFSGLEIGQKDLREFANWYSTTAIENITFASYPAAQSLKVLRCVFIPESKQSKDSCSFEKQFTTLMMLKNSCQAPIACFIAFEPTGMDNHFIFGVLVNRQLLIVNPLGNHFQEKNYASLIKAAKTCHFSIVVSRTALQRDPDGLVSCGVFSAELMRHIATLSADVITKALTDTKAERCELKLENNQVLPYVVIDIANTPLLPASLHDLHTLKPGVDYQNKIVAIRHSHFALLEKGTNTAQSEQVLFNRLLMEPKFLDQLSTDSVHASLIRRFSAVDEKLPTSFPVNMPLSTTHSVTAGIRSKQNIPLREKLKLVTGIPTNTVLDVIVDYCASRSDSTLKEHARFFAPLAERKQDKPIHVREIEALQAESKKNYELAQQHFQTHWGYEYCLRAAFYSQAALALVKHNVVIYNPPILEQLKAIEQAFPRLAFNSLPSVSAAISVPDEKQNIVQDLYLNGLGKNPYKIQLLAIRQFAREQLKVYQTPADAKTLMAVVPQPPIMQSIYKVISQKIKELFVAIISESVVQYQKLTGSSPPCDYAFIALGSLARQEITPYSDLEFGLLLEDKANKKTNDDNKIYFRNLCRLINFKLLALGETPANILNIPMPLVGGNAVANPILKGMCFDARVHGGHKNPLGKRNDIKPEGKGEVIFELLGTIDELGDYQDQCHYDEDGKLKAEPFLASSLFQANLIVGGKGSECSLSTAYGQELADEHAEKVKWHLSKPIKQLWEKPVKFTLGQARTLELLLRDIERFRPKMGKVEETGRSYSVKHDLYRLFNTIFDHLALFYNLPEVNLWDQIQMLATKKIFSPAASKNLLQAIARAKECRLAAYLGLDEQFENAALTNDDKVAFKGHISHKIFHLPMESVFQIYYVLFPFWQAVKRFRDTRGDAKVFQDPIYKDFYDDSQFMQGQIKLLLEGQAQALKDFKEIIAQEEKNHDQKLVSTVNQSIVHAQLLQVAGKAVCETKDLRKVPEGIDYLKKAIAIYMRYDQSYAAELHDCYLDLALSLQAQGKLDEAKKCVKVARDIINKSYGSKHLYAARCDKVTWYLDQPANSLFSRHNRELKESWHLPPNNDQYFVGREKELTQLRERFKLMEASQRVVLSAVLGLGGIGKTQLALQYIHHPEQSYSQRFWFRAESEITLLSDYLELVRQFKIPLEEKAPKADVIEAVKRFLEQYPNWLAVYDNAGDYQQIKEFLPRAGGHLIITTRRQEWHHTGIKISIDIFSPSEAVAYLKKVILREYNDEKSHSELDSMKALAKELGYLPLALAQAGAYIQQCGISVKEYLNIYRQHSMQLLADETLPVYSDEPISENSEKEKKIKKTIATTWVISLKAIFEEEKKDGNESLVLPVLHAMSYLHADNIPRALLEQWIQVIEQAEDSISSQLKLNKVIRLLHAYSIIQINVEKTAVSMHRLTQMVIRHPFVKKIYPKKNKVRADFNKNRKENVFEKLLPQYVEYILNNLAEIICLEFDEKMGDEEIGIYQYSLLAHLKSLVNHIDGLKLSKILDESLANMLSSIGRVLHRYLGVPIEAKAYYERSLQILEGKYGKSHVNLVGVLVNFGDAQYQLGNNISQISMQERALKIEEAEYGIQDIRLVSTLLNLASGYQICGELEVMKALAERALMIQETQYGKDNYRIAHTLSVIATAYGGVGNANKKKCLLERALEILEMHHGKDHYATATILHNLANANSVLGNSKASNTLYKRALQIEENKYGKDHWQVAITLASFGATFIPHNLDKAEEMLKRALTLLKTHFGKYNVHVFNNTFNLISVYKARGNLAAMERLLSEYENKSTSDFFDTSEGLKMQEKLNDTYDEEIAKYMLADCCEPEIVALLWQKTEQAEKIVRERFQEKNIDFNNPLVHFELTTCHCRDNNPLGAIVHKEIALQLIKKINLADIRLEDLYHELACYYHCYAWEQNIKNNSKIEQDAINKAKIYFEQALQIFPSIETQVEYGNFLLRQQKVLEGVQQLEDSLREDAKIKISEARIQKQEQELVYNQMERITLDSTLQAELSFWFKISLKATTFARYLLVTVYGKQEKHLANAKTHLLVLQHEADEINEALVFSLLGHAYQAVGDYKTAATNYQRALSLKPHYTIAKQQLQKCQTLLIGFVLQPQIDQKTIAPNDSKVHSISLTAASAGFFQSASIYTDSKTQNNNTAFLKQMKNPMQNQTTKNIPID